LKEEKIQWDKTKLEDKVDEKNPRWFTGLGYYENQTLKKCDPLYVPALD
jgi:hypothetical protein